MKSETANPGDQTSDPWVQRARHKWTNSKTRELADGCLRYFHMALRHCRFSEDCARGLAPWVMKTAQHTGRLTVKEVTTDTTANVLAKLAFSTVSSACCPVTRIPFAVSGQHRAVMLPCGCCISAQALQEAHSGGVCAVCGCSLSARADTADDHHLASLRSELPVRQNCFPSECRVLYRKYLIDFGCTVKPSATGVGQQIIGPGKDRPLAMGRGTYMLFDHHDEGSIVTNVIFHGGAVVAMGKGCVLKFEDCELHGCRFVALGGSNLELKSCKISVGGPGNLNGPDAEHPAPMPEDVPVLPNNLNSPPVGAVAGVPPQAQPQPQQHHHFHPVAQMPMQHGGLHDGPPHILGGHGDVQQAHQQQAAVEAAQAPNAAHQPAHLLPGLPPHIAAQIAALHALHGPMHIVQPGPNGAIPNGVDAAPPMHAQQPDGAQQEQPPVQAYHHLHFHANAGMQVHMPALVPGGADAPIPDFTLLPY